MEANKDTSITVWRDMYLGEFLPQTLKKKAIIVDGFMNALNAAIPDGKLRTFFDTNFSMAPPYEEVEGKYSLWDLIDNRLEPWVQNFEYISFSKKSIRAAGFANYKEFHNSLVKLNDALKDGMVFYPLRKKKELHESQESFTVLFTLTLFSIDYLEALLQRKP